MEQNIWRKVFISFFLKDLVYFLPLVLITLLLKYLLIPRFFDYLEAYSKIFPIIAVLSIICIKKLRYKKDQDLINSLESKIEEERQNGLSTKKGESSAAFKLLLLSTVQLFLYGSILYFLSDIL